jgi:hypothetical protein
MIVKPPHPQKEITIDLSGPDGNAFALMAYAERLAKEHGLEPEPILAEMMSGDYPNLVRTLDRYFGHCLILIEPEGGLE